MWGVGGALVSQVTGIGSKQYTMPSFVFFVHIIGEERLGIISEQPCSTKDRRKKMLRRFFQALSCLERVLSSQGVVEIVTQFLNNEQQIHHQDYW